MQTIISSPRFNSDGASRSIVAFLQQSEFSEDEDFLIYYDYPIYSDYDRILYKPDLCIWAKSYGFFAVRVSSSILTQFSQSAIETCDAELAEFSSLLFSKFVKSKILRAGVQKIKFEIHPIIYVQDGFDPQTHQYGLTSQVSPSLEALRQIIQSQRTTSIDQTIFDEVRSIIEGAKALSAVSKAIAPGSSGPVANALLKLEYDISNFDARQRQVALSLVPGPHRIRGLAGSGKTIILAAKAALIHLAEPTSRVLVTYYTRSLRETLKVLVTRFYRHVRDDDPDWNLIHIRHGWGGASTAGVYADACRRAGLLPLSFSDAQSRSRRGNGGRALDPFAYACTVLNQSNKVEPFYD
jgi:superfamily I DNA and RNA helicase